MMKMNRTHFLFPPFLNLFPSLFPLSILPHHFYLPFSGERLVDFEPFYPDRMASRILGMGDVVSLVEKAAAEVSDEDAFKMVEKMRNNTFDFDDFIKQLKLGKKVKQRKGASMLCKSKRNAKQHRVAIAIYYLFFIVPPPSHSFLLSHIYSFLALLFYFNVQLES
jgi:hypothetical protein